MLYTTNINLTVTSYGAKPDGKTDCTSSFQRALDAAEAQHIPVVSVPEGNFAFYGRISIPQGVSLQGSWQSVPSHGGVAG